MSIVDFLRQNAREYSNEVALVEINPELQETKRITWRDYDLVQSTDNTQHRSEITWSVFDEKANRVANLLIERGIGAGDKVAILLMNCLEWLPLYFGILKTGAVVVPLNFRYTSEEIDYCLNIAEVNVLFFGPEFIGRIEQIVPAVQKNRLTFYVGDDCPSFAECYRELIINCSSQDPYIPLRDSDNAAIYFSSGTTGFPKAILHNHESLIHAAVVEQKHHSQTHSDVFLCIPPLYHTGAKMHWFGSLITGSKAVLLRGVSPLNILNTISDEQCTICWLLVPWAQDLLMALESGELNKDDFCLDQWRLMHIGAQPVPKSLIGRWKKMFPNHQYDTNYGLSEAIGPGCVHLGVENIEHVGAIGVPGYGWQAQIVDNFGMIVPQGEIGELCVKGPGVMTCYYNDPEASNIALRGGWLYTGDMAKQDKDGFYWLVDRKKDVIISGGENIYPVQIEDFLSSHPSIKDVAVIGLPDKRLGEISAAIIQLKKECCLTCKDEINTFCERLPRYKRPRKIIFADVPRNPTGKIEKNVLRERYGTLNLVDQENRS